MATTERHVLRYSFMSGGESREFDDIVETLGASGVGTLEVIPDEGQDLVPHTLVRLYNDTAAGTFGSYASPVYPVDYLSVGSFSLSAPDARSRLNVGFHTLTEARITVLVYGIDGRLRDFRELRLPARWTQMTSASEVAGSLLLPGEAMVLSFAGGIVPFYTLTENRTNDPTLFVAPPMARSLDVGHAMR